VDLGCKSPSDTQKLHAERGRDERTLWPSVVVEEQAGVGIRASASAWRRIGEEPTYATEFTEKLAYLELGEEGRTSR
jgi:hypothetical protein